MTLKKFAVLSIATGVVLAAIGAWSRNAQAETTLITLGTRGGPLPTKDRMQSSNLLVVNGTAYLIDAGGGVTHRIVQAGYDFRKVNKIFVTHAHGDHSAGLATLLSSEWEYKPAVPIDVFTETTSPDDVVELFKKNGAWQAKTPSEQEGFLRHMHEEHVTPQDIGKMATKAGVKAVVMSHLGPTINPNDDYQRFVDEAKKYYSGPITIAKDLMKF